MCLSGCLQKTKQSIFDLNDIIFTEQRAMQVSRSEKSVALMENVSKDPRKSTPFFFLWGLVTDTCTVAAKTLIPQRETGMEHN